MVPAGGRDDTVAGPWTVLVVEDDAGLNRLICRRFSKEGFRTDSALCGREAVEKAGGTNTLLLLDYVLPDMNGRQVIDELRSQGRDLPFIVMTGRGDERTAVEMLKLGAWDYVTKDADFADRLAQAVQRVVRDVETERRLAKTEAALGESEERYRRVTENVRDFIYAVDGRMQMTFAGGNCEGLLGVPADQLTGQRLEVIADRVRIDPAFVQTALGRYAQAVAERRETFDVETELPLPGGGPRWIEVRARIQYDASGQAAGSTGVVRDITERKQAEERLAHLNRVLRVVRSVNRLITHERDRDRLLRQACVILTETRGYGAAFVVGPGPEGGQRVLGHAGLAERAVVLEEAVSGGALLPCVALASRMDKPVVLPNTSRECQGCTLRPVYLGSGSLAARIGHGGVDFGVLVAVLPASIALEKEEQVLFYELAADIGYALHACEEDEKRRRTEEDLERHRQHLEEMVAERTRELKQAQEDLVRHEKLATLGRVAGSVAHELRNPLSAIRNASFFLQKTAADRLAGKALRHLQIIDEHIERANCAITAILDFTQGQPAEPKRCVLRPILDRAVVDAALPANVRVLLEPSARPNVVCVDDRQMEVVFRNILTNAAQAMTEGGTVRVSTRTEGPAVKVSIRDAGVGVKLENMARLFEPLFTTKDVGVGLGLALCKALVEANRGTIAVESQPGKGTTVTVTLPATPAAGA